ncbi:hypothetical protein VLG4_18480 [Lactobacillus paragasseri]
MCPGAGQRPLPGPTSIRLRLDPPKTAKFSLLEVDNASAEPNVNKTTTDNNNFSLIVKSN